LGSDSRYLFALSGGGFYSDGIMGSHFYTLGLSVFGLGLSLKNKLRRKSKVEIQVIEFFEKLCMRKFEADRAFHEHEQLPKEFETKDEERTHDNRRNHFIHERQTVDNIIRDFKECFYRG
jgi:hypothetical protein